MNAAIYYPSISFKDVEWLLRASLLWDKIYRIVPYGVTLNDDKRIKPLIESGDIGVKLSPPDSLEELTDRFLREIENYNAAAFCSDVDKTYVKLHRDKFDVKIRSILDKHIKCKNGWYGVPTDFATHYMCYLANYMAEKNNLHVISDDSGAWASESLFRYRERIGGRHLEHQDGIEKILSIITIPEVSPYNFSNCKAETIIEIREKYKDERELFISYILEIYEKFSSFDNKDVASDYIEQEKGRIHRAIKDYQRSMASISSNRLMGKLSFLIPLATTVIDLFSHGAYSLSRMVSLPIEGTVIGAVCGLRSTRNVTTQKSNVSYLLSLETAWRNLKEDDLGYNYYLNKNIEELIND